MGGISVAAAGCYREILRLVGGSAPVQEGFSRLLKGLRESVGPRVGPRELAGMMVMHFMGRRLAEFLSPGSPATEGPSGPAFAEMAELLAAEGGLAGCASGGMFLDLFEGQEDFRRVRDAGPGEERQGGLADIYRRLFAASFPDGTSLARAASVPAGLADFSARSAAEALERACGKKASDEGVLVTEPFGGTGIHLAMLIAAGLLGKGEALLRKCEEDVCLYATDPLSCQLATINVGDAVAEALGDRRGSPFGGACLADPFRLVGRAPSTPPGGPLFLNDLRVARHDLAPQHLILGIPPSQAGAFSGAQAGAFPVPQALDDICDLDRRILDAVPAPAFKALKSSPCDQNARALEWSRLRLCPEGGAASLVTDMRWLEVGAMGGVRSHIVGGFSSVRILCLRGDRRVRSGAALRREGEGILARGRPAAVSLSVMARGPGRSGPAEVGLARLGDRLSRQEKLDFLRERGHVFSPGFAWERVSCGPGGAWTVPGRGRL
jgi:predicted helicase